nr:DNA replication licensing factor MCM3 [Tanacetum cinerariifolium]
VLKSHVESALKVLNFAIYHQELTDMEERENQQEKEQERKRRADGDGNDQGNRRKGKPDAGDATNTEDAAEAMEVDEPAAAPTISAERAGAMKGG